MSDLEGFVTMKDLARSLHMSQATVRATVAKYVPVYQVSPRKRLVKMSDVATFIESKRQAALSDPVVREILGELTS